MGATGNSGPFDLKFFGAFRLLQSLFDTLIHALHGHDPWVLVLLLLVAIVAGLARGFSGFGGALLFVPLASAIVGPKLAGPLFLIADVVAGAPLIPSAFAIADKRDVSIMSIGAFLSIPLGTAVLGYLDPYVTRWFIACTAFTFLILLVSGWRYRNVPTKPLTILVGAVSGFFSGLAQLGGPPVVTYWLSGQNPAVKIRANIVLFFAVSSVITACSYLFLSLLSFDAFLLAAMTCPTYALGLFAGARAFGFAREETFRRTCYTLIGLAVIVALPIWDRFL